MEQRKRVSTAEKRFLAILEKDPSDTRTYVSLGTLYERQRRPEEARRIYEAGCAVAEGGNPHLWTALGNLERKVRQAHCFVLGLECTDCKACLQCQPCCL